jgi:hypothetical protein
VFEIPFVPNYCHIVAAARNIRPDRLSIYEQLIDLEFMELALETAFRRREAV